MNSIPLVNLEAYRSDNVSIRNDFVKELGDAFKTFGFARIIGHGVDPSLIESVYDVARHLFSLPESVKKKYTDPKSGFQRGITKFAQEYAKQSSVPDLKEFWHVGRELAMGHPFPSTYAENIWPEAFPEFRDVTLRLYQALDETAIQLLQAIAEYLQEPRDRFSRLAIDGNSVLRILHYPPLNSTQIKGAIRAAEHEDINLITLLPSATSSGLEILTRDQTWMPIISSQNEIIADTGDIMQRITNGLIPSTTHRVVNPDDGNDDRYSLPFFVHPYPSAILRVLAQCRGVDFPEPMPDISAIDFLHERLKAQQLMK